MRQIWIKHVEDLPKANARLAKMAYRKLRLGGKSLEPVIKRSNMPAKLRSELRYAIEAEAMLDDPEQAAEIDLKRIRKAHARAWRYLENADPKRDRERRWLGIATVTVVNLTIFFTLLALFLRSQM